MNELDT